MKAFAQLVLRLNISCFSWLLHSSHADAESSLHLNSSEHERSTTEIPHTCSILINFLRAYNFPCYSKGCRFGLISLVAEVNLFLTAFNDF